MAGKGGKRRAGPCPNHCRGAAIGEQSKRNHIFFVHPRMVICKAAQLKAYEQDGLVRIGAEQVRSDAKANDPASAAIAK